MPPKVRYLLPSIAQALFVLVFLQLSLNAGRMLLADCDTGFHIKAGEFILDTRSIPKYDPFSLFSPPMPWPTHEWLSDVIMASIARISGLSGVVLFFIFVISATYSILFRVLRANKGNILVDIVLIVLVLVSSQMHWLARPHMFTLLFLTAWYFILDSYQNDRISLLYLLPPIMLLWINLHGGFVLGFMTIVLYLLHNSAKAYLSDGTERESHKKKAKYLLLATLASFLLALVNPKGIHTFLFPFDVVSNRLIMDNYMEFRSPNFHYDALTPFRFLLLLTVACFGMFRMKLNFIEMSLVLVFLNMSLFSVRYIPLFAIAVAPILSRHGNTMLGHANDRFSSLVDRKAKVQESIDESARGYIWPVAAVLFVICLAAGGRIDFRFDEKLKPVAAVEFLKKEHIPGRMFNKDEFGDYIIYSAYPRYKVFFDGRADIYGNEKLQEYLNVANMRPGWEKVLDKYDINWIIYDTDSPLSQILAMKKDWKLVYTDNIASIYVKNVKQNEYMINKYLDGTLSGLEIKR